MHLRLQILTPDHIAELLFFLHANKITTLETSAPIRLSAPYFEEENQIRLYAFTTAEWRWRDILIALDVEAGFAVVGLIVFSPIYHAMFGGKHVPDDYQLEVDKYYSDHDRAIIAKELERAATEGIIPFSPSTAVE